MTDTAVPYKGQWPLSTGQQAVACVVLQAVDLWSHLSTHKSKIHPINGRDYWKISSMTIRSGEELKPRLIDMGLPTSAATVPQS